ncbi:hypothetical protein [Agrobacterium tumefaciens]|uniref:hypothetical protein n=1 Tax=Agrobacterium tumefaciens TaxID=358 RepID=UPI001659C396|nr:hypothetical protein [Agrobacterium tumefaciens]QNP78389.1 hypothetical protein IAI05_07440 [Agrobacterium tumefaciens]
MQTDIPEDIMKSANAVVAEMLKEPMLAMAPFIARALKAERVRCEAALSAAEPIATVAEMGAGGMRVLMPHPPGSADHLPIGTKLYAAPPAPSVAVKAEEFARQLWGYFKGDSTGGTTAMQWFDNHKSLSGPARLIELCRSALSAQVQDVAEWQDISTAPRDGTTVLLYAPGWDSPKTGWTYGTDDWQDCPYSRSGDERYQPTHWMPVPTKQGNRILHKHTNIRSGE